MGNSEDGKSSKSEKSPSPVPQDQTNIHVYPDWAAMQAYYGPRVALPPYYNSAVASGHAPHPYMWAPPQFSQPMMPPYGSPYAAIYSHGGVYAHPGVPLGSHGNGYGVPSSPSTATPLSIETPTKSSGNTDRGLIKKLKGFDGLAMSIGNGSAESAEGVPDHGLTLSVETEGSSDGSDGNTTATDETRRKRSPEGTPVAGKDGKTETPANATREANLAFNKVSCFAVSPSSVAAKSVGPVLSPGMTTAFELKNPSTTNTKTSPGGIPPTSAMVPSEAWTQNEREVKRERRKQSNRESARRSRLRKQAEAEELGTKVESLNAENLTLKTEINRLTENSEKLKLENAKLMEKLKSTQVGLTEEMILDKVNDKRTQPVSTENLLSRVNNSSSVVRSHENEGDMYENSSNPNAKLRQLLDANPRADTVAAG